MMALPGSAPAHATALPATARLWHGLPERARELALLPATSQKLLVHAGVSRGCCAVYSLANAGTPTAVETATPRY